MDDSVVCGIRLNGELICQGLEFALIRPEIVALRPEEPKPWGNKHFLSYPYTPPEHHPCWVQYHGGWTNAMPEAGGIKAACGIVILEACCLGLPIRTWIADTNQTALYDAIMELSHAERFEIVDGKGAERVAALIVGLNPEP